MGKAHKVKKIDQKVFITRMNFLAKNSEIKMRKGLERINISYIYLLNVHRDNLTIT